MQKKVNISKWKNPYFLDLERQYHKVNSRFEQLLVDFENGETIEATGAVIHDLVFISGEPWIISANGTIFRYDKNKSCNIALNIIYVPIFAPKLQYFLSNKC